MDEHQATDKTMKACPRCFEQVRVEAEICRYCHSRIANAKDGQYARVRIKAGDKIYRGDLFVAKTERISAPITTSSTEVRRLLAGEGEGEGEEEEEGSSANAEGSSGQDAFSLFWVSSPFSGVSPCSGASFPFSSSTASSCTTFYFPEEASFNSPR